jgi:NAD(P)-dependent dehydrogenase (short-subunit alcohol dehydrogenase family)
MSIIFPIKAENIFTFNFTVSHDPKIMFPIMDLLKRDISPEILRNFIRGKNHESISLLISMIPFSYLMEWYYENQIMRCYWSGGLIERVCKLSYDKFKIKYYNGSYWESELVNLLGKFNLNYNFMPSIINKRSSIFASKFGINLLDFYGGTACVELFGSNALFKKVTYNRVPYRVRLYPKVERIVREYTDSKFNPNLIIEREHVVFEVVLETFNDFGSIIISHNEDAVIGFHETHAKIACKPIYYNSRLDEPYSESKVGAIHSDVGILLPTVSSKKIGTIRLRKHKVSMGDILKSDAISKCYVCKEFYHISFTVDTYIDMCSECGRFNYERREMVADLSTVRALVTGVRVKIGYAVALKLLRCGSKVIGTTRYPSIAALNFHCEPDYEDFKGRLTIIKCNFLNLKEVHSMLDFAIRFGINAIINNACQTIRQSNIYVKKVNLLEKEVSREYNLLQYDQVCGHIESAQTTDTEAPDQLCKFQVMKNLMKLELNQFNDIRDVRHPISWDQEVDEIDPGEIVEAVLINQLVPTLIVNKLKGEFNKLNGPKFIINVTALEGQFNYNKKNSKHLHTNMCKAAMNMMVRTLAEDPDPNLYVYCIDPGYVSGVCPQLDHYPLSMHDGASRTVYPILRYYSGDPLPKNIVKMRNFMQADW